MFIYTHTHKKLKTMLYKNGKPIDLESKFYKDEFAKMEKQYTFPVILRYRKDLVRNSVENKRLEFPNSLELPNVDIAIDPETRSQVEWAYSEAMPREKMDPSGRNKYMDYGILNLSFKNNSMMIKKEQMDLLYFLVKKSRWVEDSDNAKQVWGSVNGDYDKSKCYLRVENRELDAKELNDKEGLEAEVKRYLYGRGDRLTNEALVKVANAMFLEGMDRLDGEEQLRRAVGGAVKDNNKAMEEFIDFVENKGDVEGRNIIQEAFEKKLLMLHKGWVRHFDGQGKTGKQIFEPLSESSYKSETYEWFGAHPESMELLKEKVEKTRKAVEVSE